MPSTNNIIPLSVLVAVGVVFGEIYLVPLGAVSPVVPLSVTAFVVGRWDPL